jgi:micrococcal nuclease
MKKFLLLPTIILTIFLTGCWTDQQIQQTIQEIPSKPPVAIQEMKQETAIETPIVTEEKEKTYLITRVIDGDTIEIEGGQRVRYIGVDTPETVDPRKPVQCFGVEASNRNKALVEGKQVRLEKDVSETDKYGRLLRYVYVDKVFVNLVLVQEGYAYSSTYPPDVKYQDQFIEAQRLAREQKKGLWGGCPAFSIPVETSPTSTPTATPTPITQPPSGCTIKGNISSSGEKIYHMIGCGSYNKTKIDEARGERWFCNEAEAVAAGWRKAKNCP